METMRVKRKVSFSLKKYGKSTEAYMIRLRVSYNGTRVDLASGFNLPSPSFWNEARQRIKPTYQPPEGEPGPGEINAHLDRMAHNMDAVFAWFEQYNLLPSPEEVKERFHHLPSAALTGNHNFFLCFDAFTRECGAKNAWTPATYNKFSVLRHDLEAFNPNLLFEDLNEDGLISLICFWRDGRRLRNSTIDKKLSFLRWFLNWATERGFNENRAFKTFRATLKRTQKKVIFLTREELAQLSTFSLPHHYRYLEKVRDVFLFCCFTGLRHSDAVNLRRSDIKGDHIEITTVKTADSLSIELNRISAAILNKYKKAAPHSKMALPHIINQTMNRDIKTLCRLAGIDEEIRQTYYKGNQRIDTVRPKCDLVGTHTGRRTFIVNALSLGIAPNIVMKWTGHSDYKSMKPYIDIVDDVKAREMSKLDTLI